MIILRWRSISVTSNRIGPDGMMDCPVYKLLTRVQRECRLQLSLYSTVHPRRSFSFAVLNVSWADFNAACVGTGSLGNEKG
jgi:hypothetical protein